MRKIYYILHKIGICYKQGDRNMAKKFKTYGRKSINKLDWLIAIAAVVIALGAIILCIGVSVKNAAPNVVPAFQDVLLAFGFVADASQFGQGAVVIAYNSAIIYASILLVVVGAIVLMKKGRSERVPGLFAELVAAIGATFFISFAYEILSGSSKGYVHPAFPIVVLVLLACLVCIMVLGVYGAFSNCNIELKKEEAVVEAVVEDEPYVEPEEEKEPEPEPVVEEEPVEEPEEEEEDEEEDEEDEEEGNDNFKGLGKRRRRIPFERKLAKADVETKQRYKLIVDRLRAFNFNDRKSIPGETFSYKREKLVFLTFSGKTLKVYFKLDPMEFLDSPLPIKDATGIKKYEDTPAFLKIKSDLAARRAAALGERLAQEREIPESK